MSSPYAILASEYAKETNNKLFDEDFTVYTHGPVIPAVAALFHQGSIGKEAVETPGEDTSRMWWVMMF